MDLVRPSLVALGAWLLGGVVAALVLTAWTGTAQLQSAAGRVLWVLIPQLLVGLVTAGAASYAHRRPERNVPGRHALAVLMPTGVLIVFQALLNVLGATEMWATGVALAAQVAGGLLGWLLVSRVIRRGEHAESSGGYF